MRHPGLLAIAFAACGPEPAAPAVEAPAPVLRRLTYEQYVNIARDLVGADVVVPERLEPDTAVDGFQAIGASVTTISPRGVELYEDAAYLLASQAVIEPARGRIVPCEPTGPADAGCARDALEPFVRLAWRRPPASDEIDRLVDVYLLAADALDDFDDGLVFGLAAALMSPSFLYREEVGEADPAAPGERRYTSVEMASRLSFLLWNTGPDDELLDAAEAGDLVDDDALADQAERLLDDPRARRGLRVFFTDIYGLYRLDDLQKDPFVFSHMSAEVGPAAREETLLGLDHLIFDEDGDFRDIFTTQTAFVDRTLASIYNIPAPDRDGFGEAWLDESWGRRGLLGQTSFLALYAHPTSSSATLRGKFVRERVLCDTIPPPPSDVDTSIPEPSGDAPTLRERVAEHLENEFCAGCHTLTDPIGLGFEQFDGIGRYRVRDHDAVIDPSGDLDGVAFADAWDLAEVVADDPKVGRCLTQHLVRFGAGRIEAIGEIDARAWLADGFVRDKHRVRDLVVRYVTSPLFRRVGEVAP